MTADSARQLAKELYEGRVDRVGIPEFDHLERAAAQMPDDETRAVAYLHDAFEDGLLDWQHIDRHPALDEISVTQAIALFALTRQPDWTYMNYIRLIAKLPGRSGEMAKAVKLADNHDNMTRKCPDDMLDMRKPGGRYDRARKILERTDDA